MLWAHFICNNPGFFLPFMGIFLQGREVRIAPRAQVTNFGEKYKFYRKKKSPKPPQIRDFFPKEEYFP